MSSIRISAPGKVMISGEYVVLEGAPALVGAVSARAHVFLSGPGTDGSAPRGAGSAGVAPLPPEAVLARKYAESARGIVPMELGVDTEALRSGERKLGLGSSAAAAAGAAAAVHAYWGSDPADAGVRRDVLRDALAGHHAVAPQGSGADVAASVLGGFVRFERHGSEVDARRIAWPSALALRLVWTGTPARTSDLVARVKALGERDPASLRRAMDGLREAAAALGASVEAGDARAAIDACAAHGEAMRALGIAADAPIVTDALARAATLAAEHGGAAKPSGAGGGDVALAFFASDEDAQRFGDACPGAGLTLLALSLGEDGVRRESASNERDLEG